MFNTHLIVDDQGDIRALYRKIHLFKVDLPTVKLDESVTINAGSDMVVCDSPVGRLGLTTCYDLRFPDLYRNLRDAGAQIMLVPSAFTVPTGKDHWEPLLRARTFQMHHMQRQTSSNFHPFDASL
jgi:deaminated glutathione amidase